MSEIIVALIGLAGSAAGSLCGIIVSGKLTEYRLKQVEKHNCLIERTYALEEKTVVCGEKLKSAERRIENLERKSELSNK